MRHVRAPSLEHGEDGDDRLDRSLHAHRHRLARPHAELHEPLGSGRDLPLQLRERHHALALPEGDSLGRPCGLPLEPLYDRCGWQRPRSRRR